MKKKVKSRHAYEFCVLIIELLFNATLNPGPKTEASPMQIKDLLQKKVGPFLRTLFVTTIFNISEATILDETKFWKLLLSNPILNQDLKRLNDFKEWKIEPLFKKKFEIFQVYKFKTKSNNNGMDKSEKEENNLSENKGNSQKKPDLTEEEMLMKFHSLVQEKGLKEINFKDLSFANSKQLGIGGSGRVHKGAYLETDVAIKEYIKCNLFEQEFEENNRSLLEELQKIEKLCFPKVNKCYGICVNEKGTFFTVHELAECSLEQKLKVGKLSIEKKHKITSQILEIMLNLAKST